MTRYLTSLLVGAAVSVALALLVPPPARTWVFFGSLGFWAVCSGLDAIPERRGK